MQPDLQLEEASSIHILPADTYHTSDNLTTTIPFANCLGLMLNHPITRGHIQFHKPYHLVIEHSHGKSLINGGLIGNIICKWAIFHGYVK